MKFSCRTNSAHSEHNCINLLPITRSIGHYSTLLYVSTPCYVSWFMINLRFYTAILYSTYYSSCKPVVGTIPIKLFYNCILRSLAYVQLIVRWNKENYVYLIWNTYCYVYTYRLHSLKIKTYIVNPLTEFRAFTVLSSFVIQST